jgi:hypothetical protein
LARPPVKELLAASVGQGLMSKCPKHMKRKGRLCFFASTFPSKMSPCRTFLLFQAKNHDFENFNLLSEATVMIQKRSNPDSECLGRLEGNMNFCSDIPEDRRIAAANFYEGFFSLIDKNISQK